jgi:opacity protein-like surface antigen
MGRQLAAVAFVLCVTPEVLYAQEAQPVLLTVTMASASVHKSASTGSPVVGRTFRGRQLEVTREVGDWLKVSWPEDPDGFGYIHRTMGTLTRGTLPARTAPGVSSSSRQPFVSTRPAAADGTVEQLAPREITAPARTVYVARPTHVIGLGGQLGGPTLGFGVSGRVWTHSRLGVQMDVFRVAQTSVLAPGRMTSVQFAPGALFSLHDHVTDYVWLRPYAGGGMTFTRQTLSGITPETSISENDLGFRGFGGAELTFASAPKFAISVDAGYDSTKTQFPGFEAGGFTFTMSGHWYFK